MASILKVDKLDPQSGTALEIGTSGDTITVPSGATLDISSATLTPPATLPASSGVNLTALNASNLGSGTVPTARLGSGTASSSVFLAGDNTWAAAGGGKVLQVQSQNLQTFKEITSDSYTGTNLSLSITPANSSNKILIQAAIRFHVGSQTGIGFRLKRNIGGAGETLLQLIDDVWGMTSGTVQPSSIPYSGQRFDGVAPILYLDSPSTTSATVYSVDYNNELANNYCNINGSYTGGSGTSGPISIMTLTELDYS